MKGRIHRLGLGGGLTGGALRYLRTVVTGYVYDQDFVSYRLLYPRLLYILYPRLLYILRRVLVQEVYHQSNHPSAQ